MGTSAIDVLILGVSHRTAPVAVRERLAVVPEALDGMLAELAALPSVREAALISTCNRVEIYAAVEDADRAAVKRLFRWLADRVEELTSRDAIVELNGGGFTEGAGLALKGHARVVQCDGHAASAG